MKKKVLFSSILTGSLAAIMLIATIGINIVSFAKETIQPLWEQTSLANVNISNKKNLISVSTSVKAKESSAKISGELLLCENDGNGWTIIDSWNISGTGRVTVGKKYKGVPVFICIDNLGK